MHTLKNGETAELTKRPVPRSPKPGLGFGWGAITGVMAGESSLLFLTMALLCRSLFGPQPGAGSFGDDAVWLLIFVSIGALVAAAVGVVVGAVLGLILGTSRWEKAASWVAVPMAAVPPAFAPRIVEGQPAAIDRFLVVVLAIVFALIGYLAGRWFKVKIQEEAGSNDLEREAELDRQEMDRLIALQARADQR